jgi:hypothetical protein
VQSKGGAGLTDSLRWVRSGWEWTEGGLCEVCVFGEVLASRLSREEEEVGGGFDQAVPDILVKVTVEQEVVEGGASGGRCRGGCGGGCWLVGVVVTGAACVISSGGAEMVTIICKEAVSCEELEAIGESLL